MTAIQELVREIENLTPMPAVIHPLLEVMEDPNAGMAEIADIIQYDPAITASVLRVANSAYFGLKYPAESVKDAANLLGTDQIVELVLLKASVQLLKDTPAGHDLNQGAIWKSSVSAALIARQMAMELKMPNRRRIFTAALLKDIGKTVLDRLAQNAFSKISVLVRSENISFIEAEKRVTGVDHAELGAMIAKIWKFSPQMVKIIRYHHIQDPTLMEDMDIAVVYLADCICMMMGMGVGADSLAYRFHKEAMKKIGMDDEDITRIIGEFNGKMQEVEALLKVV